MGAAFRGEPCLTRSSPDHPPDVLTGHRPLGRLARAIDTPKEGRLPVACDPSLLNVGAKVLDRPVVHGEVMLLSSVLVAPDAHLSVAALIVVLHAHAEDGPHPREGVDHQPHESTVA